MTNNVIEISLDLIDEPDMAMRENVRDDEIDSLVASIRQVGLLEPLVVRPVGERYGLIAGHRRLTAMRIIGKAVAPCTIMDVSENDALTIRFHENSHRENVNPVDEAVYIGQVMNKLGYTVADVAAKMNRSVGYVYDRLAILEFPDYLVQSVADKKLSISAAIVLNKIKDEVTKRNYIEIASKDGITVERANAWLSMVEVGAISADTTSEQLQALAQPEQHNETMIACAACKQGALLRQMVSVWIHKDGCPSA